MELFKIALILLITCNIFIYIMSYLNIVPVISLFCFGILVSNSYFKTIINKHITSFDLLTNIAIIGLMFIIGLETSYKKLMANSTDTIILSLSCFIIPFLSGFLLFKALGYDIITSIIVGLVMTVTSEAITGQFLMEKGALATDLGSRIMGIGLIDDIFGIIILASLLILFKGSINDIIISISLILSFIIGIHIRKHFPSYDFSKIKTFIKYLLVPFFFIGMGLHFNISLISSNLPLLAIITLVAVISKIAGSIITKPFVKYTYNQLSIIGWGVNSRGMIGIAILLLALRNGLINEKIYSIMVTMTLITIIMFFIVMTQLLSKYKPLLD